MFKLHTIEKNSTNNAKIYEKNEIYLENLLFFFHKWYQSNNFDIFVVSFTSIKNVLVCINYSTKGRIKSDDPGEFSRLKKIFQISLLSYYIQYMTMIKYLCNLLYCKLENTIIL
jgi:hypothetical protein